MPLGGSPLASESAKPLAASPGLFEWAALLPPPETEKYNFHGLGQSPERALEILHMIHNPEMRPHNESNFRKVDHRFARWGSRDSVRSR
eukprot:2516594-Amphidinium_carterae.1